MNFHRYWTTHALILWILGAAATLTACGGGSSSGPQTVADAGTTPTSATMKGTASKGLLANALVTVHAVANNGTISKQALATTVTNADGNFEFDMRFEPSKSYLVKVTAKEGTTHLDEVTKQPQPLSPGFILRTMIIADLHGNLTGVAVTPFSEMAVTAATSSGSLTNNSATQALSTISQLLGFDPTTVAIKTPATATTPEEQKMAILLTAVSQLANNGQLGCTTSDTAARVSCVVQKLAQSASTSSLKLAGANSEVAAQLSQALTRILNDPSLSGHVSSALFTPLIANLHCTQENCGVAAAAGLSPIAAAASTPEPENPTQVGILAAKSLFTQIRSDWRALFVAGTGASTTTSAVESEALQFRSAMQHVQMPVEVMAKDLGAVFLGAKLYEDYKSGRSSASADSRGSDIHLVSRSDALPDFVPVTSYGCSLYQDADGTTRPTSPANANYVSCTANFYADATLIDVNAMATVLWQHRFVLSPSGLPGQFNYTAVARKRTFTTTNSTFGGTGTGVVNVVIAPGAQVRSFSVSGSIPGAFRMRGTTLVNHTHEWDFAGTYGPSATPDRSAVLNFSGLIRAKDAQGALLSTLQIPSASIGEIEVNGKSEATDADFNMVWTVPGASFKGRLGAIESAWTQDHSVHIPTRVVLEGTLTTIRGGTSTDFTAGVLNLRVGNVTNYTPTANASPLNYLTYSLDFVGSVTAPQRPKLELAVGASRRNYNSEAMPVSLQYRSILNGAPRHSLTLSGYRNVHGVPTVSFFEAASGLSMIVTKGATTANLTRSGHLVGVLDAGRGILNFSDGSFMSLELGP
jgi:hypothetical protein